MATSPAATSSSRTAGSRIARAIDVAGAEIVDATQQADIILIRTDQVNVAPLIDPVATVVICADTSNVDSVFVAGRAIKRNGQLVGADMSRTVRLVESSRDYLLGKSGLLPDWLKK